MRKRKAVLTACAVLFVFLCMARWPDGQDVVPAEGAALAGTPEQSVSGASASAPGESFPSASAVPEKPGRKENVRLPEPSCQALREIIAFIDGKDYEAYAARTDCVAKECSVESGIRDRRGFFNLRAVRLMRYLEITEMPEACGIIDMRELKDAGYRDIHVYTVELDCRTYREDSYFFDGRNYFMAALGTDGEAYRLLQFSQPVWKVLPEAARILGLDESIQIFIQNERMKGNIIGSGGNLIETNRAGEETPETACTDTGGLPVKDYLLSLPVSMKPEDAVSLLTARLKEKGLLLPELYEKRIANGPEKTYIGEQAAYWVTLRSGGTDGGIYGDFAITADGEKVYERDAVRDIWVALYSPV